MTGFEGIDIFIMQSQENFENVVKYMRTWGCDLHDALSHFKLNENDFTDADWIELIENY